MTETIQHGALTVETRRTDSRGEPMEWCLTLPDTRRVRLYQTWPKTGRSLTRYVVVHGHAVTYDGSNLTVAKQRYAAACKRHGVMVS